MDSSLRIYRLLRWFQLLLAIGLGAWAMWCIAADRVVTRDDAGAGLILIFLLAVGIELFRWSAGLAFTWSGLEPDQNN
jgi:hypothetical protein